jgi:hypothetical protein
MADQESHVRIVKWPAEALRLQHAFKQDEPCPVSIKFEATPAHVILSSQQPLDVNMNMNVFARQPVPVCISLCEPICARSDYTIGVAIFDNAFASITVRGLTRLFNCKEDLPVTCVGFERLKPTEYREPFEHDGLTFAPLGAPLRGANFGDPAGQVKLAFPRDGVRISFPGPVRDVRLTVNNYAGPTIEFEVYAGSTLVASFSEPIANTVKQVALPQLGVTDVVVKGGDNEASIVEVCYAPMRE